jgi:putative transposase
MGDTSPMPWRSGTVEQRRELVELMMSDEIPVTELCAMYSVSRKTAYKWLARSRSLGVVGLQDWSRAPLRHPNATPEEVEETILGLKATYPRMGPKKLRTLLSESPSRFGLPAASTIGDILARHGQVQTPAAHPRRQSAARGPLRTIEHPNDTWCIDFKGDFRLGDGQTCYPLTVTDAFSRYLLEVRGFPATRYDLTRRACQRLFEQRGLPAVMRSDGGVPFFGRGPGALSQFSVWLIKLGIHCERVGRPQDNGQHERMHRTLKQHTALPPAASARAQQRVFNEFRHHFNEERPHEGLQMKRPASLYAPSTRALPASVSSPEYPQHCELRVVSRKGLISWKKRSVFFTEVLAGEPIGIEEIDDGVHRACFGSVLLGLLLDRKPELGLIHPGSKALANLLPMSPVRV